MTAFIPVVPTGSFCGSAPRAYSATSPRRSPPRMAYDPNGPPTSKYLSNIPADRLNKAPVIAINAFPNEDCNSISVFLADLEADEGAGDSLKAGVYIDPDITEPDPAKYEQYYPRATLNEAPYIGLYGGKDYNGNPAKWSMYVYQQAVPTVLDDARSFLGDIPPDPKAYPKFADNLHVAPDISLEYRTSNTDSGVQVDWNEQFLNIVTAAEILAKYRR